MKTVFIILALSICNCCYSQKLSQIDSIIRVKFPANSSDGWHYKPKWGKLIKLNKPEIERLMPDLRLYRANLEYTLSYHIDESFCVLIYNTQKKSLELIEPIWFSGTSINFLNTFKGKSFKDSTTLKKFITEVQNLIGINSDYPVKNTRYGSGKITFEVINTNINNRLWRSYVIEMNNMTIKEIKYK